jgi:hypothetical protein
MSVEHWWDDSDNEKRSTRRETCASANLSTINPALNGLTRASAGSGGGVGVGGGD